MRMEILSKSNTFLLYSGHVRSRAVGYCSFRGFGIPGSGTKLDLGNIWSDLTEPGPELWFSGFGRVGPESKAQVIFLDDRPEIPRKNQTSGAFDGSIRQLW